MKKRILIIILVFLILLLFPLKQRLKDGGSIEYKSIIYKYTKLHRLYDIGKIETGTILEIFGSEVIHDTKIINIGEESMDNNLERSILINDKRYNIIFENNETVKELLNISNKKYTMNELNGNEKYVYLDTNLKTNSYKPKHINKGDVMLYQDDCLVIFYKSFDTSYSYTYLGHIDNLDDLNNESIEVIFE